MLGRRRELEDILQRKKIELDNFQSMYDHSIATITSTIDTLGFVVNQIDTAIEEIDQYTKELDETKNNLSNARERNKLVLRNFNALLGYDYKQELKEESDGGKTEPVSEIGEDKSDV